MASSSWSEQKTDNNDRPTFSNVTPHFFNVVLHKAVQDKRLIMPKKFVLKHGKTLSNEAIVKLPCGSEWKMELRKSNGMVWFQKGWPEFAKHYSIGFGHLIIFKYKGDSRFDALIFDLSFLEIDYPIVPSLGDEPNNVKESEDRDNSVEVLEKSSPCNRKRKSSESNIFRSPKKFRAGPIDETPLRPEGNHDQHNVDSHCVKTKTKGKVSFSADQQGEASKSITAENGNFDAFRKANNFESAENFTYNVVMKASHVSKPHGMTLPSYFARKFLTPNKSYSAVLKLVNGRTWPIFFHCRSTHDGKIRDARFIQSSWKKFSRENDLKVGDTCGFELINRKTIFLFKVSIIRGEFGPVNSAHLPKYLGDSRAFDIAVRFASTYDSNSLFEEGCSRGKSTALRQRISEAVTTQEVTAKRANGYDSNNFTYKIVMKRTHVIKPFDTNLPTRFARKFLINKTRNVILKTVDGRTWPLTLHRRGHGRNRCARLDKTGWKKFSLENRLKLGDICNFELIDESKLLLEVSISRARDDSYDHPSNGTTRPIPLKMNINPKVEPESDYTSNNDTTSCPLDQNARRETQGKYFRRNSALEAASKFSSPNPFFTKAVTSASLKGNPVIQIPTKFSRVYFQQQRRQIVTLKLGTNSWNVSVCCRVLYHSFTGHEWSKFATENSLNAGDVCVYELIEEIDDRVVFKVSVFRALGD